MAVLDAACRSGLDLLELGVPFSDPTADGPVIQRASQRALKSGMTLAGALEMIGELRKRHDLPIILFSYYNPVLAYGPERLLREADRAGIDGILLVDLPSEDAEEFIRCIPEDQSFSLIRLIAPTTSPQRIASIAESGSGFLYVISKKGVTGAGGLDTSKLAAYLESIRKATDLPLCVGFGVSTPKDAREVARVADGVVVGSAFVRIIEEHAGEADLPDRVGRFIAEMKQSCKKSP
jgi:tryptophan synthase alpha chain